MFKKRSMCLYGLLWLAIGACSTAPVSPPPEVPKSCPQQETNVVISATARSNADSSGEGYPVQVRVYQLAGDSSLKAATYEDILDDDAKALGNDLLRVEQITLFPDSTHKLVLAPDAAVQTIAFVALFRQPQGRDWYALYDATSPPAQTPCPQEDPTLSILLDRMQVKDGAELPATETSEDATLSSEGEGD